MCAAGRERLLDESVSLALDNPAYSVRLLPVPVSVGDTGSLVIYLPLAGLVVTCLVGGGDRRAGV